MKRSVVIVAGGSGTRMQSEIPKQFLEINGKPVIIWTIEKFLSFDPHIQVIVVLPGSHMLYWQDQIQRFPFLSQAISTAGGISRFHSVRNGLAHVNPGNLVGIHDAVRPLVSLDTLERCYAEAEKTGCAIPVIDMEDSLRRITKKGSSIFNRNLVKRVQTPQTFSSEKILTAYENCLDTTHTDDASVYESYFGKVHLVEGNKENLKITYPSDIRIAEILLTEKS